MDHPLGCVCPPQSELDNGTPVRAPSTARRQVAPEVHISEKYQSQAVSGVLSHAPVMPGTIQPGVVQSIVRRNRSRLEPSMRTLDVLRSRMLEVAGRAREQHIDKQVGAYAESRKEVEAILEQLRELYKQDAAPFDEKFLGDIRTAKLCSRTITRSDLDRETVERERQSIVTAHEAFLRNRGLVNRGTRLGLGHRRVTHCYNCKCHLDNAVDVECATCGWIICGCGACGCGYAPPG